MFFKLLSMSLAAASLNQPPQPLHQPAQQTTPAAVAQPVKRLNKLPPVPAALVAQPVAAMPAPAVYRVPARGEPVCNRTPDAVGNLNYFSC